MANTTFSGAVRSENGFQVITKDADTGAVTTQTTLDANGNFTTDVLGINIQPTLAGQTVTAKATGATITYVAGINVNPFTGAAQQITTLPAATVGVVCIHAQSKDTAGGTAFLRFDCASTDAFATGSVIESTATSALTFDVSAAGETELKFTPANAATNCMSTGSRIYFYCTTAGIWNISTDLRAVGSGVTGTFAFAA
jgi:hypothetical protein